MTRNASVVHSESIIIDGLATPFEFPIPPTERIPDMLLGHLLDSGLTAVNSTLFGDAFPMGAEGALMKLHDESLKFEVFPEKLLQVRTVEDIERAKRTGKLGLIYGVQGLASIGRNIAYIWVFHSLGIKIMQLTYNEGNALGSGCMEPNDGGLTRRGQQAIEAMNRLGVVLDLSHVGIRTSLEAIGYCETPPIFSHSSVRALCDHPRNLTDEQIVAVAEKGGVVGLCPIVVFVEKAKGKRPTLDDYLDHIDYVAEMVGIDHVGVGTDAQLAADTFWDQLEVARFDRVFPGFLGDYGLEERVEDFHSWSEWINVTRGLLERGYSEEDTQKVLGGNFLRVFQQVWK
jgi:membrane dipeptidase